ncbi:MAG: hypothetical protein LBL94_06420 [Prevotellaceae bacterium]|jgi:hypothetical protein|nr:hypothetical protein [Prevotellaceae bacterium]
MGKKKQIELVNDFDFGNIEIPELDPAIFDIMPSGHDDDEQTRYTKPKVYEAKPQYILYENADRLARELTVNKGERADVFVSGSFIFGDFIEAYIVQRNAKVKRMTITTLSLSQENVDSLHNLLAGGFVDELNLIVSAWFYAYQRDGVKYIYEKLDIDNKFQLAIASIHSKIITFETLGGRKIIIHGSANLKSNNCVEQFTIEENAELYDFYNEYLLKIVDKYKTIKHKNPIRNKELWDIMTRKKFND